MLYSSEPSYQFKILKKKKKNPNLNVESGLSINPSKERQLKCTLSLAEGPTIVIWGQEKF